MKPIYKLSGTVNMPDNSEYDCGPYAPMEIDDINGKIKDMIDTYPNATSFVFTVARS